MDTGAGRTRRLWAVLVLFLAAVLTFTATAANASAAAWSTTQTRVGVSAPAVILPVGLGGHIGAGQHPVRAGPQQDLAQGNGVHDFYVIASPVEGSTVSGTGTAVLVHNAGCNPLTSKQFGDVLRYLKVNASRTFGKTPKQTKIFKLPFKTQDGRYITRDVDGHGGRIAKVAHNPRTLETGGRDGSYGMDADGNLKRLAD